MPHTKQPTEPPSEAAPATSSGAVSASSACSALWLPCPGCPATPPCEKLGRCAKNSRWKAPTTGEELNSYGEELSLSIFHARREMKRHQKTLDALEPLFERVVRMIEQNDSVETREPKAARRENGKDGNHE